MVHGYWQLSLTLLVCRIPITVSAVVYEAVLDIGGGNFQTSQLFGGAINTESMMFVKISAKKRPRWETNERHIGEKENSKIHPYARSSRAAPVLRASMNRKVGQLFRTISRSVGSGANGDGLPVDFKKRQHCSTP